MYCHPLRRLHKRRPSRYATVAVQPLSCNTTALQLSMWCPCPAGTRQPKCPGWQVRCSAACMGPRTGTVNRKCGGVARVESTGTASSSPVASITKTRLGRVTKTCAAGAFGAQQGLGQCAERCCCRGGSAVLARGSCYFGTRSTEPRGGALLGRAFAAIPTVPARQAAEACAAV